MVGNSGNTFVAFAWTLTVMSAPFEDTDDEAPAGRVAKRQAAYADALGGESEWKDRLGRWDVGYDVPEDPLMTLGGV